MMRFQNPIMLICAGLAPTHAFRSLMATTYMKWRMNSIVRKEMMKRRRYFVVVWDDMGVGRRCCKTPPDFNKETAEIVVHGPAT